MHLLTSTLDVNASTTSSQLFAFITLKMEHCHETPPAKDATVEITPSPFGKPMVHWDEYRNTYSTEQYEYNSKE
jgi:hypothetical protein